MRSKSGDPTEATVVDFAASNGLGAQPRKRRRTRIRTGPSRTARAVTNGNNGRKTDGKFATGNPGRPKGARHRTTVAIEALLQGEAVALTRRAIESALEGDTTALRLCLERLAPPPRDRTVKFDFPQVRRATDVPRALSCIVSAVAAGDLSPTEGETLARIMHEGLADVA